LEDPQLLPPEYNEAIARLAIDDIAPKARVVADYIAGMTDRYAIGESERLFNPACLT